MKMKKLIALCCIATVLGSCAPKEGADSLNENVALPLQEKVYFELRDAMKKVGKESLAAYPKSGTPSGGAEEYRRMQDSLRLRYWVVVLDSNDVATNYGDSIWTKGVKLKWRLPSEAK
jgi:hypothetical protein